MHETLKRWHEFVNRPDAAILDEILAENVRFHSPFVWKPKEGKAMTKAILLTVIEVFQDFRYEREIAGHNLFCLEFAAAVGEYSLRGVDLIELDADGRIVDFEVMIRPANALQALGAEMTARLGARGAI